MDYVAVAVSVIFQWPSLAKEKFQRKFWINLSNNGIAWGIWLARNDLVFNGRPLVWDRIFLSHFASIGFVVAIKE
jgi:hypothetical protein